MVFIQPHLKVFFSRKLLLRKYFTMISRSKLTKRLTQAVRILKINQTFYFVLKSLPIQMRLELDPPRRERNLIMSRKLYSWDLNYIQEFYCLATYRMSNFHFGSKMGRQLVTVLREEQQNVLPHYL